MAAAGLTETILTFAAIVGIGAVLRWSKLLGPKDAKVLNVVIIYVGLPALVFNAVHGTALSAAHLGVVGVSWAVFLLSLGCAWLVQRASRMRRDRAGGFMLAASLGNTGYLGYPLTAALLGGAAVPYAVFSDVFGTVVALVTVGLPIAARMGTTNASRPSAVKELLTFPAVIALVAALALRSVIVPEPVSAGLGLLASLVAPMIMLSVGLSLRPGAVVSAAVAIAGVVVIKLLVAPALAVGVGSLVLEGEALRVAVLQAGMPSMMLTLVVGERYGLDTEFIAGALFVSTLLAAVTLPLVQRIMF